MNVPPPGRRVLVTGAASGLGAAVVAACAARGDRVLATDRVSTGSTTGQGATSGQGAASGQGAVVERGLDVRSEDDWAAARSWVLETWGGLDVLVNNAGIAGGGRVELCSMEEWAALTEVNLFGVVRGCRTFAPVLKAQGSGTIVNVASLAGLVHPPGMGSYNAVKAAVVAFSETLSHELAPYGVRCSVLCPSYFRTGLAGSVVGGDPDVAAKVADLVASSQVTPGDVAAALLEGLDRGEELVLPDAAARAAYHLKRSDRAAYDEQMRRTATRMKERDDA